MGAFSGLPVPSFLGLKARRAVVVDRALEEIAVLELGAIALEITKPVHRAGKTLFSVNNILY